MSDLLQRTDRMCDANCGSVCVVLCGGVGPPFDVWSHGGGCIVVRAAVCRPIDAACQGQHVYGWIVSFGLVHVAILHDMV